MRKILRVYLVLGDAVSPKFCMFRERHWLPRCSKFRRNSLQERQNFVNEKKLCSNCLSAGHFVRECPKGSFCKVHGCTGKHSTFLHPKSDPATEKPKGSEDSNTEQTPDVKSNSANNGYVKSHDISDTLFIVRSHALSYMMTWANVCI